MQKVSTSILLLISFLFCSPQTKSQELSVAIDFKNISLEDAQNLAKQSGKGIFMDVYAVWCVPCKQFEKTVFTNTEVGNKFNASFINLKIDAEKEAGKKIARLYKVGGYPTGIFINAEGILLSKFEGVLPKEKFMEYGDNALKMMDDPHGYEKAVSLYSTNKFDLERVRNLLHKAILSGNQIPPAAMDFYFSQCEEHLLSSDKSDLTKWVNSSPTVVSGKETYQYFLKNTDLVKSELSINDAFLNSFFYNSLQTAVQNAAAKKDLHELQEVLNLNTTLPLKLKQAENIDYELDYYLEIKDFENYLSKMHVYCKNNYAKIDPKKVPEKNRQALAERINSFGWNFLLYSEDKNDLAFAEKLMQTCIALDPLFGAWYDTYAGIIYKQGRIEKAIEIENKAVLITEKNKAEQQIYLAKIERMKRGEKIWLPEQY